MLQSTRVGVAMIALSLVPRVARAPVFRMESTYAWLTRRAVAAVPIRSRTLTAAVPQREKTETPHLTGRVGDADLLRAEFGLLRQMDDMGEALNRALRDPVYMRDRRSASALNDASRRFKEMTTSFRSMTRDVSRVIGEEPLLNDGRRIK